MSARGYCLKAWLTCDLTSLACHQQGGKRLLPPQQQQQPATAAAAVIRRHTMVIRPMIFEM